MDNKQQGAELNQLSRVLFNEAATLWQWSIVLEIIAGFIGVICSLVQLTLEVDTAVSITIVLVLAISLYKRYRFEIIYEDAETMRRQSVLSEGLNWAIAVSQFNDWKNKAGSKILKKFSLQSRSSSYYESQQVPGPKKLAEMTFESAYWTKCLYRKLRNYFIIILVVSVGMLICVLSILPITHINVNLQIILINAIYLIIPVMLSIDLTGLVLKLSRNIQSLFDIEKSLETICQQNDPDIAEVMRLVSEYNCIVSGGIPIPNWFFSFHHDDIQASRSKLS